MLPPTESPDTAGREPSRPWDAPSSTTYWATA
ncbi:hypothetical protein S1361_34325 [Streptomyces cyanogenus]|uniref:Lcm1 n=1 Tax=Streptomyces cyanogenus TaxID=80860 RepID=A0A896WNL7_STRCY|nr:Lcm1 [Streptomyces cyanogenus]QTE02458.1 hypothetical protein S1361_34325 [Streptomyces cyanogenus]